MMNAVNISIGHQIRTRRKELGLAREELARKTQLSADRIRRHETGQRRATAEEIDGYANALNVQVRYLFEGLETGHERAEDLILKHLKQWLAPKDNNDRAAGMGA